MADSVSGRERLRLAPRQRWAACSAREFGPVGETRHVVTPGHLTSLCGATATHPDIWRANGTKPRCPECVTRLKTERR